MGMSTRGDFNMSRSRDAEFDSCDSLTGRRYVRDLWGLPAEIMCAERLRIQVVIATLRRVLVMVTSIRGFVEGVR